MKTLFLALLLLISSSVLADTSELEMQYGVKTNPPSTDWRTRAAKESIQSSHEQNGSVWRTEDTYRETTFQILNIIDWGQTRYVAEHPEQFQENESAWAIGSNPTVGGVDSFMLKTAILHVVISNILPQNWRSAYQYITIGGKLNAIIVNASIGIKVSF